MTPNDPIIAQIAARNPVPTDRQPSAAELMRSDEILHRILATPVERPRRFRVRRPVTTFLVTLGAGFSGVIAAVAIAAIGHNPRRVPPRPKPSAAASRHKSVEPVIGRPTATIPTATISHETIPSAPSHSSSTPDRSSRAGGPTSTTTAATPCTACTATSVTVSPGTISVTAPTPGSPQTLTATSVTITPGPTAPSPASTPSVQSTTTPTTQTGTKPWP
jgi:hypothetical protein